MEIPLITNAMKLIEITKVSDREFLTNYFTKCETHHEMAEWFLALWIFDGVKPQLGFGNKFIQIAVEMAESAFEQIQEARNNEKARDNEKAQTSRNNEKAQTSRNNEKAQAKSLGRALRSPYYEPVQHRLTTGVTGIDGGYILAPSDAARRQAKIQRDIDGLDHKGARFIQPKMKGMNGVYQGWLGRTNVGTY